MDFHVITAHGSELLLRVVDGQAVIVPPAPPGEPPAGEFVGEIEGNSREA